MYLARYSVASVTRADVVLALIPADRPEIMDVVEVDEDGKIRGMYVKPGPTDLHLCW